MTVTDIVRCDGQFSTATGSLLSNIGGGNDNSLLFTTVCYDGVSSILLRVTVCKDYWWWWQRQ